MQKIVLLAAIVAGMFIVGCRGGAQQHDAHDGHNHDAHAGHNHDEKLQIAAYNDRYEIFAQTEPFAAGSHSHIVIHVTELDGFNPVEGVAVSVALGDAVPTVAKAVSPGIYKAEIEPAVAGKGVLTFDVGGSQVTTQVRVSENLHKAQHYAADMAVESANGVMFPKEQSWKVDFATDEAVRGPFGEVIKTVARVMPAPGDEAVVSARAGGMVVFSAGVLADGVAVKAGQPLFSLDSEGMLDESLMARYLEATNEYVRAKAEYERKTSLAGDKIVPESELQQARAEYKSAEIAYNNLSKHFADGRYVVRAPMSGYIREIRVRNGEYAAAGQPVVVIAQNRDLVLRAEVQPRYYQALSQISSANFRPMNGRRTYSLEELGGRMLSYGKSAGADNPLIPVTFSIRNVGDFLPGSFVETYISAGGGKEALTVPNGAIVEEMGNYFVFVQLTPEYFEKRTVQKGATDGVRTEIVSGVAAGERVVSKGAILVKLSQSSGTLDPHAGHVH